MNERSRKHIMQFQPLPGVITPWEYGWGFETKDLRFVMYAPENFDGPTVRGQRRKSARAEHGPAHVHVMDIATGQESRFTLIEGAMEHRVALFEQSEKVPPLNAAQAQKAARILKEYVPEFLQMWRVANENTALGGDVIREGMGR